MTDILLIPLQVMGDIFIAAPYFAFIPALLFGFLYTRTHTKLQLSTTLLWGVYALYELAMKLRILCSGECNIRIDLLLIYPLLLIISLVALFHFLREN